MTASSSMEGQSSPAGDEETRPVGRNTGVEAPSPAAAASGQGGPEGREAGVDSVPANGWLLRYEGVDPHEEPVRETLCSLGNGRFATRAVAPEARADGVHYPGTYAA